MLYLLVIITLFVLSSKYDFDDRAEIYQNKERAYWFICTLFILIAGLRYNIGADTTDGYAPEYLSFQKFSSTGLDLDYSRYQPGWIVFESICRLISPNFLLLQFIHAFFINIVFFYFIHKYSKLWFSTILIYAVSCYMQLNTEVLRESMAVAFALLAYDSKVDNKYILMIVFAILSYLFHVSGIMAIILILISFLNDSRMTRIIFLSISVLFVISYAAIDFNTKLLDYIFYEGKVDEYLSQNVKYSAGTLGWILYYILWVVFPLFIFSYMPIQNDKQKCFVFMFILFCSLKFLCMYSFFFNRFANYLFPFYWITIALFYKNFSSQFISKGKTVLLLLVSLIIFYSYHGGLFFKEYNSSSFNMGYERYYPYRSVLEEGNSYIK